MLRYRGKLSVEPHSFEVRSVPCLLYRRAAFWGCGTGFFDEFYLNCHGAFATRFNVEFNTISGVNVVD